MKVLVIGGSSGMGKGLALRHAKSHDDILLVARTEADLQSVAKACIKTGASSCSYIVCDVANMSDCVEMAKHVGEGVNILYMAVGLGSHQVKGTAWEVGGETTRVYERLMQVNFFGPLNCLRVLLPGLHRAKTHIVVLNSASGLVGLPGRAAYCASKAALNSLCETLLADAVHDVTITEVFIVSVSGTNLRSKGLTQGLGGAPAPHTGTSSSEIPLAAAVDTIHSEALNKTRRVYIPSKLRAVTLVKHAPLIPSDKLLEKMVWAKARL